MADEVTTAAMGMILEHVSGEQVFYERQLQVLMEKEFFHWVTSRALRFLI